VKKIIFKELREQFKVAVLGLAVLTLMVVLIFAHSVPRPRKPSFIRATAPVRGFTRCWRKGLTQVAFFCCIFGALLGWLQIRAEGHPDLWAFLVHRPIPRTKILQAKIISGLILYAAGAGLPILGLVIVSSIPGKVAAPFAWAMALPLVAIFLVGMVFYGGPADGAAQGQMVCQPRLWTGPGRGGRHQRVRHERVLADAPRQPGGRSHPGPAVWVAS
jgi:hypothetical protein